MPFIRTAAARKFRCGGCNISIFGRLVRSFSGRKQALAVAHNLGQAAWSPKDYATLARVGYENCAAVYAAVNLIARSASDITWYVQDDDGNEIDNHPVLRLLTRPNNEMSGTRMFERMFTFLLLSGNAYLRRVVGTDEGRPIGLYVLRSDLMRAVLNQDRTAVVGWQYGMGAGAVRYTAEDVLHIKEFHPTDDFYGLSRLEVAARDIDVANAAKEWNLKLLQNDLRPGGLFNFRGELTPEQRQEIRHMLDERSGPSGAGRYILTEGAEATFTPITVNPKDIDWLQGQKYTLRQICAVFGVPSELLGDSENKTYSNYREARRALYEETILPLMDLVQDELNRWLMPAYKDTRPVRLVYDRDSIEALQEERERKYAYLANADWVKLNEKREATGYGPVDGGDEVFLPVGKMPLSAMVAGGGRAAARPAVLHKSGGYWSDPERRLELWYAFDTRARRREASFISLATEYFRIQGRKISQAVLTYATPAHVNPDRLLDIQKEASRAVDAFWAWYLDHAIRAGEAGLRAARKELYEDAEAGILMVEGGEVKAANRGGNIVEMKKKWEFVLAQERERELRAMIYNSGTKVSKTTLARIKPLLVQAVEDNWTSRELSERIYNAVEEFTPSRSRLWAETETTKIENWAMLDGYRQGGAEKKGWNCAFLEKSREEHVAADGQIRALNEPFEVGGELLDYPGDPRGSAWNVCNCRCSQFPVVD